MADRLDFLRLWVKATTGGIYRAFAWWEGGYGVENVIDFLRVTPDQESDLQEIQGLLAEHEELYFYPSAFRFQGTQAKLASPTPLLWLDLDTANPSQFPQTVPQPSAVWETSEGHFQALWLLDRNPPQEERTARNHWLYDQLKDLGADPSFDTSRRLRLPGTLNRKPQAGDWPVRLQSFSGMAYAPSLFGTSEVAPSLDASVVPVPSPKGEVLRWLRAWSPLLKMWDESIPEGKRSLHMSQFIYRLLVMGVSTKEVFSACYHARSNKWRDRPQRLWTEVLKADELVHRNAPSASLPWAPGTEPKGRTPGVRLQDVPLWVLHDSEELLAIDAEIRWDLTGFWPKRAIGMIVGGPGSRKSWVASHMGLCLATERSFFHIRPQRTGPVIYHALDDPPEMLSRRYQNILEYLRVDPQAEHVPFYWSMGGFHFAIPGWVDKLREDLEAHHPVLCIIDGLYLAGYNPQDWGASLPGMMAPLKELRAEYDCGFLLIHHKGRSSEDRDTRTAGMGSTFIGAFCEIVWNMEKEELEEGRQKVSLKLEGKYSPQSSGFELGFGNDLYRYEPELSEIRWSPEKTLALFDVCGDKGLTEARVIELSGQAPRTVKRHLRQFELDGALVSEELRGRKRVYYRANGKSGDRTLF